MKTVNRVILLGYVASEPKDNIFENGHKCVNVSLKTRDFYTSKNEQKVDKNFHNLIFWNGIGEKVSSVLKKGDTIHVIGHLKNKKIVDKASNKNYYATEVVVDEWTKVAEESEEYLGIDESDFQED